MKFEVVEDFKIKTTSKGIIELRQGQVVEMSPAQAQKLADKIRPLPHIDHSGTLIIPFDSPQKYHWWNRGQSIRDTLRGLEASDEILKRYKSPYSENWEGDNLSELKLVEAGNLMTPQQAAQYLQVRLSTIYNWSMRRILPV